MKAGGDWHVPLFDSLMSLGITSFAFDLGNKNPMMILNPDKKESGLVWNDVVDKLFWTLKLDSVRIDYNGTVITLCEGVEDNCWITPDSGTSNVTFPKKKFQSLSWFPDNADCTALKPGFMITFKIGGLDYELGWDDMVSEYGGTCDVRVSPLDVKRPGYKDFYIVGAVFL